MSLDPRGSFRYLCQRSFKSGQTPVCLFPTRIACDEVNKVMLTLLDTTVHELTFKDEIDQTESTRKWDKKATQQLEKLNSDCNKIAGLGFVLNAAVGARVMIRRNIAGKSLKRGILASCFNFTKSRTV